MNALTIQQPWIWAIFTLGKDIENRGKKTALRERVMLHAGKTYDYDGARWIKETLPFDRERGVVLKTGYKTELNIIVPGPDELPMGGFCGSVEIVDDVDRSDSKWFFGPRGYVLHDPIETSYVTARGMPGFFSATEAAPERSSFVLELTPGGG